MRIEKKTRMKVVCSRRPIEFEEQFNKAMEDLKEHEPTYELREVSGSLWAIITYKISEEIVESVRDEFHLEGRRHTCSQCPLHEEVKDRRLKMVPCKYSEYGEANLKEEACEYFYKMLKQGQIEPTDDRDLFPKYNFGRSQSW